MSDDRYYIDISKSFRKSLIVYAVKENIHYPVMYISKPKFISQQDFDELFSKVEIRIKKDDNE